MAADSRGAVGRRRRARVGVVEGDEDGGGRAQTKRAGDGGRPAAPGQVGGGRVQDGEAWVQAAQGLGVKVDELE